MKKIIKKIIIILIIFLIVILGRSIYLYATGWYDEPMVSGSMYTIDNINEEDDGTLSDSTSYKNAKISFRYIEGLDVSYIINARLEQGTLYIQLVNVGNSPWYFEEQNYEVLYQTQIEESGIHNLEIPNSCYTEDERYYLYVYGSDDIRVVANIEAEFHQPRWQWLHDQKLAKLPWVHKKYDIDKIYNLEGE